jgi:hypothetical protein
MIIHRGHDDDIAAMMMTRGPAKIGQNEQLQVTPDP